VKAKLKRRAVRKRPAAKRVPVISVLSEFHCQDVSYYLDLPLGSFDTKRFFRTTGIKAEERWSAVLRPKDRMNGYHVHFKGRVDSKHVHLTVEYWDGARKAAADEEGPFAESIMQWLGSFIKEPNARAVGVARFLKPIETWKSRFNLPFRVTMADVEVTIDGVSLVLPRNKFRAMNGFLARSGKHLVAVVQVLRYIEFDKFNIIEEVVSSNEAIKMFLEQVT
jgi:hypothetical protein